MKRLLLFTVLTFNLALHAQPGKEAWKWVFGQAGIDFSSGAPLPWTQFPGNISAAVAAVSDTGTGQLLFYTNGVSVINKNGNTMQNGTGLLGNVNSTQTLIVPQPGHTNIYYIISADFQAGPKGIHYSIVDMSMNSGIGKVITKNVLLTPAPATEKITAVRHCNGKDYWIITHSYNSNAFNAYLLNSSGINTTPVVSNVGTAHQYIAPYNDEAAGYMKASPNGSKLAVAVSSDQIPFLEIYDFNKTTGQITNPVTINYTGAGGPYGISFSPDNSKLYACVYPGDTISRIYQYDLSSGIPSVIIASQFNLGEKTPWSINHGIVEAMQMGPDGKIYIALYYLDTLAVIQNPNMAGAASNLNWGGLVVGPPFYLWCEMGLPNFIDANYAGVQMNDIPDVKLCDAVIADTLNAGSGFASYQWNTGASTPSIIVNDTGTYWVTVTNQEGCQRTDTVIVLTIKTEKQNIAACDSFLTNVTQSSVLSYNWSNGPTTPQDHFTSSGTYWVDISYIGGCAVRDSFIVTVNPSPTINLGSDTTFCKGNLLLNAQCSTCNYQWSTGASSSTINALTAGTYWVKVKDANGCTDSDTVIVHQQTSILNFQMPNIVTPNEDNINDEIDFSKYQFSTFHIQIFNRWGQQIFSGNDPNAIWKPREDDGTYYYTAQYKIDCGADVQTKEIKGFITVLR